MYDYFRNNLHNSTVLLFKEKNYAKRRESNTININYKFAIIIPAQLGNGDLRNQVTVIVRLMVIIYK